MLAIIKRVAFMRTEKIELDSNGMNAFFSSACHEVELHFSIFFARREKLFCRINEPMAKHDFL